MFYQNGNMLISLCQYLKVNEQRSWMKLNSVPLLLRTILCYPKIRSIGVAYQNQSTCSYEYNHKNITYHNYRYVMGINMYQSTCSYEYNHKNMTYRNIP